MRLAIWKTGHQIADTVADAFIGGNYGEGRRIGEDNSRMGEACNLSYGILRGNGMLFASSDRWFNVDRGYSGANHFDGYYRISYKGTQAKWHEDIPKVDVDVELEDWRDTTYLGFIQILPPTQAVADFYGVDLQQWSIWARKEAYRLSKFKERAVIEVCEKGSTSSPFVFSHNLEAIITFNSSVGWQALQRGIPCISDTTHSLVGSYYKHELDKLGLEYTLDNVKLIPRGPLFQSMGAHQFTLMEIRQGKAWNLIQHYLNQSQTCISELA